MSVQTKKVSTTIMGGGDSGRYSTIHAATVLKQVASDDIHDSDPVPLTTATSVTFSPEPSTTVEPMSIGTADFVKGTIQEPAYRDKWFAVLFLAQLGAMIAVAVMYATGTLTTVGNITNGPTRHILRRVLQVASSASHGNSLQGNSNSNGNGYSHEGGEKDDPPYVPSESSSDGSSQASENEDVDISTEDEILILSTFLVSVIVPPILSFVALRYMGTNAQRLIQFSLFFAIGFNIVFAVVVAKDPFWPIFFAIILVCYSRIVWHRIPFAAANVKAAVTCVQSNWGTALLGLANIPLSLGWIFLWLYVFNHVIDSPWEVSQKYEVEMTDDANGNPVTHEEIGTTYVGLAAAIAMLLSFYWTWQVLKNVVHTTIAGTVGTWWFMPQEATGCCSRGLMDSLCRSVTYSFGSICFGSLLAAIIEVIRSIVQGMARNRNGGILRCIAQCLLVWLEWIAEFFNKWAFIYVGLYGYSYVDASRNVISLFAHRGWTTLISDTLVYRMLSILCLCIGLINSLVAIVLTLLVGGTYDDSDVIVSCASVAFILGILMSSMVLGVVESAVDSIIVLFAEAPAEGEANHPELIREIQDTWAQAWPDVFTPTATPMATAVAVGMV